MIREAEATADQTAEEQQRAQSEIARWQQEEKVAQSAVRAAQSTVEKAEADARLQETTFKRFKAVQDKDAGLIAAQQVDEARARMEASRAEVEAARGKLDASRQQAAVIAPQIEGARRGAAAAAKKLDAAKSRIEAAKNELQVHQRDIEAAKQQVAVARSKADAAVHQVAVAQSQNRAAAAQTRVVDSQIATARMQSQGKRSALDTATALADYRRVVAPFDGIVTERLADAGQLVQSSASGQTGARGIVKVVRDNSLRVMIPVPEADTAWVRRGAAAELHVDAYPKDTFHGTVTRFSGAVDPRSRTLLTEIQITNPKNRLRPGMYVRVRLTLEVHRGALTVPSEAVMGKEDRSVWVVADGKAKKTAVTVGVDTGKTAEITSGLQPGDTVVVVGRDALTEGAPVKTEPADLNSKK
jgi:RND family efflux transporter MFP subunit